MIESLEYVDGRILVHVAENSLKTTKAFTHGSLVFNTTARTATFAQFPPMAVPEEVLLREGEELDFQLLEPDGAWRKQRRRGILTADKKNPEILRIGGMAQTPRRFTAEDGWRNEIYKYRAYFTHPGITSTIDGKFERFEQLPQWLRECIDRQKAYWNRLAWLCRDARRRCSPVPTAEIAEFVANTVLPEIDAFNLVLGRERTKEKMRHPAKLKIGEPGLDGLWKFVGELRGRIEKKRAVPEGLLEKVVAFAEQFKADYTPLKEFMNDFPAIAEREAVALGLRRFEIRPTVGAFRAALIRRNPTKATWSEGWPLLKYPNSPKAGNWGVHYYFNKAGVDSLLLETGVGIPGLTFGPPRPAGETGHVKMKCKRRTDRKMREAIISIPGEGTKKERHELRFAVLEHRPLPNNSHLKEWKLVYEDGKLWLCLVVELKRPLPKPTELAGGLEIGWRRTEEGIRFGTLYESANQTVRELIIDLQSPPKDHKNRKPFCIESGPSKWNSGCRRTRKQHWDLMKLFPEWQKDGYIPNPMEARVAIATLRDYLKDTAKIRLRKHLGERTPPWLVKAGTNGLKNLALEFLEDSVVQEVVSEWGKKNREIDNVMGLYFERTTNHIEYGQQQVAHDVCRYLQEKKIGYLVVERSFLAKVSQNQSNDAPESLKRSQKYRQFAAPARFVSILKNIAVKYGIVVEEHENLNISRRCHYCDYLNPATEKEKYNCEGCGREVKQDHNAAINLSRSADGGEKERVAAAMAGE
jgi:hypothetical protein